MWIVLGLVIAFIIGAIVIFFVYRYYKNNQPDEIKAKEEAADAAGDRIDSDRRLD